MSMMVMVFVRIPGGSFRACYERYSTSFIVTAKLKKVSGSTVIETSFKLQSFVKPVKDTCL